MPKRPYIMVAPNGARKTKQDHPLLPISMEEILTTAKQCYEAGANGLHLHIRDKQGNHSLDSGQYRETIKALTAQLPDLAVQITTESAGRFEVPEQLRCLQAVKPAWASVSVREVNRNPNLADALYGYCADMAIRIQHILYDAEDIRLLRYWQKKGIVRLQQNESLLVLGRYAKNQQSSLANLQALYDALQPQDGFWMVCAFGQKEHDCLRQAAMMGGNVRIGIENSLVQPNGQTWQDNVQSLASLCRLLDGD